MGISWASDQGYGSVSFIPFHSTPYHPFIIFKQICKSFYLVQRLANPFFAYLRILVGIGRNFWSAFVLPFNQSGAKFLTYFSVLFHPLDGGSFSRWLNFRPLTFIVPETTTKGLVLSSACLMIWWHNWPATCPGRGSVYPRQLTK